MVRRFAHSDRYQNPRALHPVRAGDDRPPARRDPRPAHRAQLRRPAL